MNDIFLIQGSTLTDTADTIRKHIGGGGISPEDFPEKIDEVYNEGKKDAEPNLQNKTITSNGKHTADSGYDGLGTVTVNVNDAPELQEKTVTPTAQTQTVTPSADYDGLSKVTVEGDSYLKSGNIKAGVTIFGVPGNYTGEGCDHKTVERASTTITSAKNSTKNTIELTASNNQNTGLVTGSNETAEATVSIAASGKTATATDSINRNSISVDVDTAERASTTIGVSANESTDVLDIYASNNQGTGWVDGSDEIATISISLYDNGNTVTATATDKNSTKVSRSVATVDRATTTIGVYADEGNDVLTITASNDQKTGWVDGSNETAIIRVGLSDDQNTVTATATDGTSVSRSVATTGLATPTISVDTSGKVTANVSQERSGWVWSDEKEATLQLDPVKWNTENFNYLSASNGVVSLYKGLAYDGAGWLARGNGLEVTGTLDLTSYINPSYIVYQNSILGVAGTHVCNSVPSLGVSQVSLSSTGYNTVSTLDPFGTSAYVNTVYSTNESVASVQPDASSDYTINIYAHSAGQCLAICKSNKNTIQIYHVIVS